MKAASKKLKAFNMLLYDRIFLKRRNTSQIIYKFCEVSFTTEHFQGKVLGKIGLGRREISWLKNMVLHENPRNCLEQRNI